MKNHKLLIIIIGTLVFLGCTSAHDNEAGNYSDSLIVVPGAQKIRYAKLHGTDQILYEIKAGYPAKALLEEITKKLEIKGWKPLPEDYLNPGLPSSHVRGWTDFIDGTKSPERIVYQWLAQWENKSGDILWCTLRYSYPRSANPNLEDLTVSEIFIPAKIAEEGKQAALQTNAENKKSK